MSVYCRYVEGEAPSEQTQLLLDDSFTKVRCMHWYLEIQVPGSIVGENLAPFQECTINELFQQGDLKMSEPWLKKRIGIGPRLPLREASDSNIIKTNQHSGFILLK